MKKNKMMRLASALLVMTLLTTSIISGTFAKYTSTSSASDNARVAKWGVTLTANGLLYSEQYNIGTAGDNANKGTASTDNVSVATYNASSTAQSVVAPGTKSETGLSFTIDGRPEVAVALTGKLDARTTVLPAATYVVVDSNAAYDGGATVENVYNQTTTKTLTKAYYPVKYTLVKDGETLVNGESILEVCNKLDNLFATDAKNTILDAEHGLNVIYSYEDDAITTKDHDPNKDLGELIGEKRGEEAKGEYKLTWEWAFETADVTDVNVYDTFLGDIVYAVLGQDGSDYHGVGMEGKVACYVKEETTGEGTSATTSYTFYSVEAAKIEMAKLEAAINAAEGSEEKTALQAELGEFTKVYATNLAEYGIGIEEEFDMTITATQID